MPLPSKPFQIFTPTPPQAQFDWWALAGACALGVLSALLWAPVILLLIGISPGGQS